MADEQIGLTGMEMLRSMGDTGNLEITPYPSADPNGKPGYKTLPLDTNQRMQIEALAGRIPSLISTKTMASAYTIKFPEGIQGHLMAYRGGRGFGTPIQSPDGKIVAHASLEEITTQAAVMGAFNTMALVSGQYFLSEINSKLEKISMGLDKILEFLYGDKRAELLAEISFTKYAYENYTSIMAHDSQRMATIVGLQAAKKVAIKDIEFYIADLESATNAKGVSDIVAAVDKAFQIKNSLELSVQLYAMTTVLEMYFAQNYDPRYLDYIEKEMDLYIDKCDKWILTDFSKLNAHISGFKDKLLGKAVDREELGKRVSAEIEMRAGGGESTIQKSLRVALEAPRKSAEFCITKEGVMYLKTA